MRKLTILFAVIVPILAALLGACSPAKADGLVGVWAGRGSGLMKNVYEIKLTLAADKTCVLDFSDRTAPHAFNPYLKTNKLVVKGTWNVEKSEGGDKLLIKGKISEWTETLDPSSNEPVIHKAGPKTSDEDLYFVVYPDGTLQRAFIEFTATAAPGGDPMSTSANVVILSKQGAQ